MYEFWGRQTTGKRRVGPCTFPIVTSPGPVDEPGPYIAMKPNKTQPNTDGPLLKRYSKKGTNFKVREGHMVVGVSGRWSCVYVKTYSFS